MRHCRRSVALSHFAGGFPMKSVAGRDPSYLYEQGFAKIFIVEVLRNV